MGNFGMSLLGGIANAFSGGESGGGGGPAGVSYYLAQKLFHHRNEAEDRKVIIVHEEWPGGPMADRVRWPGEAKTR